MVWPIFGGHSHVFSLQRNLHSAHTLPHLRVARVAQPYHGGGLVVGWHFCVLSGVPQVPLCEITGHATCVPSFSSLLVLVSDCEMCLVALKRRTAPTSSPPALKTHRKNAERAGRPGDLRTSWRLRDRSRGKASRRCSVARFSAHS